MGGCMTATEVALAAFDHPRHESRACRSTSRDAEVKELSGLLPAALPRHDPQGAIVRPRSMRSRISLSLFERARWLEPRRGGFEEPRLLSFRRTREGRRRGGAEMRSVPCGGITWGEILPRACAPSTPLSCESVAGDVRAGFSEGAARV